MTPEQTWAQPVAPAVITPAPVVPNPIPAVPVTAPVVDTAPTEDSGFGAGFGDDAPTTPTVSADPVDPNRPLRRKKT